MRETTIFRSSRLVLAVAALAIASSAAVAQDSLQVGERPAVHVVVEGETLWALAQQYFGDPYLWPEIYRMNTLVVEDPHWIFPGEELRLSGEAAPQMPGDSVTVIGEVVGRRPGVAEDPQAMRGEIPVDVQPEAPIEVAPPEVLPPPVAPPPPATGTAPTVFYRVNTGDRYSGREATASERYRPIRRHEFYGAGFLTERQHLPWGKVEGAVGRPTLEGLTASSSAVVFQDIAVEAPGGAQYQVGDSLLIAVVRQQVSGWGNVVVPTGIVRVKEVDGRDAVATVIVQFGRIADGQVSLPLEPFADPGDVVPVPIENGMTGSIVELRDHTPVPGQQDIVFIDKGREDGVALGDVFQVLRADDSGGSARPIATMQIVHVRDHSASALITAISDLGVARDAPVQLHRKMP